jgi:ketosteroid isomerase-like protein
MARTAVRANVETMLAFLDAIRRRELDAAVGYFAPEVVWEGLVPGVECANRDAVREMLAESIDDDIDVDQLEVVGGDPHVVLGVRSRQLEELAGVKLSGQLFNVFTIRDRRVVQVRDFALRREALAAADLNDLDDWR